ncbi:transcriptional protein SWT1 isoform X2 [Clinocottus analis]|uniref:transcriptional protein SWT1 isoform X2 n=1 Tax=Clinocottus analis TaxID=304258 RepID=UPI0035C0AF27
MSRKSKKRKRKKSSSSHEEDESSKEQDVTEDYKSGESKQDVNESSAAKPEKCEKSSCKKSSSSREEDEKSSKKQDVTEKYRSGKRKQDVKESCAAKPENCALCSVHNVPKSTRHVKSALYRRLETQVTDPKPVYKQEKCKISGRGKTVQWGPSKPSNNAGTVPEKTEKTFKSSKDKTSSHRRTPKSKKQRMSPSLVSAEQKEQRQGVLKKKCRATKPPRTRNVKTRDSSKASSLSQRSSLEKKRELLKKMCKRPQENQAKRRLCTEAKTFLTTEDSSTSSKQTVSSSNVVENVETISGNVPLMSCKTVESSSVQQQICSHAPRVHLPFKIPKKVQPRPVDCTCDNNGANLDSRRSGSKAVQESVRQAPCCFDATPSSSPEGQDKISLLPVTSHTLTEPWHDQTQVVEELHLARSEKRLEVNVLQIYGELTCMDIDPPEEGAADTQCEQPPQQDLILVLDTNILLSHLDYLKEISSHGLRAPVVLIPWVVLQELDSLKRGRGMSGSVAHLATPAISYIYNSLKNRGPHLWGQSMQQAVESSNGLNAENNDDRVLQCCLQYQGLYPECALILCTNDKNLCSKALVSGVNALSKNDLEEEIGKPRHGFHPLRNSRSPKPPHVSPHLPSPMRSRRYTAARPHVQERTGLSVEEKVCYTDNKQLSTREDEEKTKWSPSSVSELEDCLREVLSDVLEVEMKAAYEDLWLEIVYLKPPWTLQDVLQCLKKHWIAVFGHIVPRRNLQTVLNLIEFFNSGYTANCSSTSAAVQEAKELVKEFWKSSRLVPSAVSIMDNIYNKLQPQWEPPACDVVMNDNDEEKQPASAQVSHQEVWALFENIWSHVYNISLEVVQALGFDPHTMQRARPVGGPPPPQDALVCLHRMSSAISQLLQAFSRFLSSAPGLEEAQELLAIIHSNKIVDMDSRFTAKDFLDCFSQPDYKEKLSNGGNQLMGIKEALDCCIRTTGQHVPLPTSAP